MKKAFVIISAIVLLLFVSYYLVFENSSKDSRDVETKKADKVLLPVAQKPQEIESSVLDYFYDVALGSEYGGAPSTIRKWSRAAVGIGIDGTYSESSVACLDKTIADFNLLSRHVILNRIETSPDITIHFAPENKFSNILKEYEPRNLGFFWTWTDGNGALNKATILIDTSVISDIERCHLIREELTQSLGLMNDSPKFSDSIFYTDWTYTNTYSDMDKKIISTLYGDNGITVGMDRTEVEKVFIRK